MLNDMTFDAPKPKPVVCDEHGPACIGHAIRKTAEQVDFERFCAANPDRDI